MSYPMETYVTWAAGLLLLGCVLAGFGGVRALAGARRLPYFQLRRQTLLRGWRLVLISVGLLIASGLVLAFGRPAAELFLPPTTTSLPSSTPNATSVPPQFSPTPSLTLPPSRTSPPTITLTPSDTPLPTISPTPALPRELVTPILTATVTPPANAIAVDMRFSVRDNCNTPTSTDFFDQIPRRIYAHFFYDNWLPGVQWSGVWLRDGQVIFAETQLWDGSTGGCGFTDFDHNKLWWQVGTYEVQIFIGETWLLSDRFEVVRSTPTATVTLTRTPRTPTLTYTPTSTRTPRTPTLTYTPTPTRTRRPTGTLPTTSTPGG